MTVNFEARRFEDAHQAPSLAGFCSAPYQNGTIISGMRVADGSLKTWAGIGDWIIRLTDGTVRIEPGGNQVGYCTDCGLPVWWQDDRLVTQGVDGTRWCYGKDESHFGMTHWHALPGMPQWVARSPDGRVCHCLDRAGPHMHEIITDPPDRAWRLWQSKAWNGDDILADLRVDGCYIPDNHRAEADRRLWELLEQADKAR